MTTTTTAHEVAAAVRRGDTVIDVRTIEEFTAGHVPGQTWPKSVGAVVRAVSEQSDVKTSWVAVLKSRCLRPAGAILALAGHS